MKPTVKRWVPLGLGIAVAVVCARLGAWQLDRLEQRQARNAEIERALGMPPIRLTSTDRRLAPGVRRDIPDLGREPGGVEAYRRAIVTGRFDFSYQQIVVLRSRNGVPGVHIATPFVMSESTVILVERGWVASPDGKTVDLAALDEPESTTVAGYLVEAPGSEDPAAGTRPLFVRRADPAVVPDHAAPGLVLRRTELSSIAPTGMYALREPELSNGPHLSYAIQWFAFGVIGLVGGIVLAWRHETPR